MSEMSNQNFENNSMNWTRPLGEGSLPSRCFLVQQREPSHEVTARMKWNKEVNKVVMKCFYRSKPFDEEGKPVRGYRERMFREWRDKGLFESSEQRCKLVDKRLERGIGIKEETKNERTI